jgi:prepilin-type N-terminal cleavage/methylation domain-containing protein
MWIFSHLFRRSCTKLPARGVGLPAGRGFTLIELLVVLAIMAILTGALLVRQGRFNSSTILRSLAYSVALSVRQAQVYGTSVVGTTTSAGNCVGGFYNAGSCYASAYGLYFDKGAPNTYILFADLNNDGQYQAKEAVKTFTLNNGYIISKFCASGFNGPISVLQCSNTTISSMNVIFKRPNPDASFTALNSSGLPISGDVYSGAYIQLQVTGDSANTKSVNVLSTGQVSVCTSVGC